MKVSLKWLRDYVDIDVPLEDLAEKLTMAGLEVEEIHWCLTCLGPSNSIWEAYEKDNPDSSGACYRPRRYPCFPRRYDISRSAVGTCIGYY